MVFEFEPFPQPKKPKQKGCVTYTCSARSRTLCVQQCVVIVVWGIHGYGFQYICFACMCSSTLHVDTICMLCMFHLLACDLQ